MNININETKVDYFRVLHLCRSPGENSFKDNFLRRFQTLSSQQGFSESKNVILNFKVICQVGCN